MAPTSPRTQQPERGPRRSDFQYAIMTVAKTAASFRDTKGQKGDPLCCAGEKESRRKQKGFDRETVCRHDIQIHVFAPWRRPVRPLGQQQPLEGLSVSLGATPRCSCYRAIRISPSRPKLDWTTSESQVCASNNVATGITECGQIQRCSTVAVRFMSRWGENTSTVK